MRGRIDSRKGTAGHAKGSQACYTTSHWLRTIGFPAAMSMRAVCSGLRMRDRDKRRDS